MPDYVHIEPINDLKDITFVAWQINLPEKKEGKMINFEFDSVKDIQTVSVPDRYGMFENVIISVFDKSQEKTDFKIIIKDDYETIEYIAFKNITLIKGEDQGFIINY